MKEIIKLKLKGESDVIEAISLPTDELELRKRLAKNNNKVFELEIIDTEFKDIKSTITKNMNIFKLNQWLLRNKSLSLDTEYSALEIACDSDLIKRVEDDCTIRKCSYCGVYTSYLEMHGEFEFNKTTHYDICDRCCSLVELDIIPDTLEEHYYDDYLEDNY